MQANQITKVAFPKEETYAKAVCHAFIAALLVSGSLRRAEESVIAALHSIGWDDFSSATLFACSLQLVIAPASEPQRTSAESELAIAKLPYQLQRILGLSFKTKCCFVARILLGLSTNVCTQVLQIDDSELSENISSAACLLAQMTAIEIVIRGQ